MDGVEQSEPAPTPRRKPRLPWITALAVSFVVCVLATFRGGYVGPDYNTHLWRLMEWSKIFDFSTTNPPIYYLFGHVLLKIVGNNNGFLFTISILQAAINTVALGWFALFIENRFKSSVIHTALILFLAFLPVRMIHSTTLGTDCTTIPAFMVILGCLDKLLATQGFRLRNALYLGAALTLAICLKYTFMALLPIVSVIFIVLARKRAWGFRRFAAISLAGLLAATVFTLASFWLSSRVHGYNTDKHWVKYSPTDSDMGYWEILSVRRADLVLFKAPQAFKEAVAPAHVHSYLGLCHMGIFTDPMNLFQVLREPQVFGFPLVPDLKERAGWKTPVMVASMSLGLIWTLFALIGTAWALRRAVLNLAKGRLEREDSTILLGTAYFLLIFLAIPFVYGAALYGYWTPRLILPAIISFSLAAFLFIESKVAKRSNAIASWILFLVAVQCGIEIAMLA